MPVSREAYAVANVDGMFLLCCACDLCCLALRKSLYARCKEMENG